MPTVRFPAHAAYRVKVDVLALLLLGSPLVTSVSSFEVNVALGVAFEPNTVVLKSNPGSSPQHLQGEARARGCGTPRRLSPGRPYFVARCSGAVGMHDLIASWSSSQAIAWAEPNYAGVQHAAPDDLDAEQWYHLNEGQIVYPSNQTFRLEGLPDADIDTVEAWDLTTGDPSVVIAIVDSGVDVEHPELVDHIWTNPGEDCTNGIDDDGNGYVDDCHGWDTGDDDPDASVVDMVDAPECGRAHGTQVAGTASATGDNGIDVVGVDWHARIMPLAVATTSTTGCRAYDAAAVEALLYAIDNGADVVNISLGYPVRQSMLWQEVARSADAAGALIVTSAGNLGREVDDNSAYPQSLEFENLIVVGNTTNRDELWSGELSPSSYGPRVDIAAPGYVIRTITPEPTRDLRRSLGTSQSAPLVAGVVALVRGFVPELSPADTKRAVLEGADVLPGLDCATTTRCVAGGRRLNAHGALLRALELADLGLDLAVIEVGEPDATGAFEVDFEVTATGSAGLRGLRATMALVDDAGGFALDRAVTLLGGLALGETVRASTMSATLRLVAPTGCQGATPVAARITLDDERGPTWAVDTELTVLCPEPDPVAMPDDGAGCVCITGAEEMRSGALAWAFVLLAFGWRRARLPLQRGRHPGRG